MRRRLLAVATVSLFGACADDPAPPPSPSEFKSETALDVLLPADAELVGVAVAPETGHRYVLDRRHGLFQIEGLAARLVFPTNDLTTRFGLATQPDFTDIVALDSDRFAVTAENDGFMLDLHNGTLASYFCYFPPIVGEPTETPTSISQNLREQGISVKERTEAVAYSSEDQLLFAQPQTFRLDSGVLMGSEIFMFSEAGGQPTSVRLLADPTFVAGGMAAYAQQQLLLGMGKTLYLVNAFSGPAAIQTFQAEIAIAGLARDIDDDLLILDTAGRRLLEFSWF
jgi:hypothetical protein